MLTLKIMPLSSARSIQFSCNSINRGQNVRVLQKPGGRNVRGAADQRGEETSGGEHVQGGMSYTHRVGLRWGAFTSVGWQQTPCDPIWQVTFRSSAMGCLLRTTHRLNLQRKLTFRDTVSKRFGRAFAGMLLRRVRESSN